MNNEERAIAEKSLARFGDSIEIKDYGLALQIMANIISYHQQQANNMKSILLLDFIIWKNDKDKNWLKFIDAKEVDEFLKINKL
jgi:hypothetical protein